MEVLTRIFTRGISGAKAIMVFQLGKFPVSFSTNLSISINTTISVSLMSNLSYFFTFLYNLGTAGK